jgi:hypothetical protein
VKVLATIALGAASLGLVAQPAAAQSPSDREIAKAGNFQAADFPARWQVTAPKNSRPGRPSECPVERKAEGDVRKNRTAEVESDKFERPAEQYSSMVFVYRTENVARRVFKASGSAAFRRCVRREAKDHAEVSGVKVNGGAVTGTGVYGNETSDVRLKFTVSTGARSGDAFSDFVFVRVGRSIGVYFHDALSESSDCGGASTSDCVSFNDLITAATQRLSTATGGQAATDTSQ